MEYKVVGVYFFYLMEPPVKGGSCGGGSVGRKKGGNINGMIM